MQYLFSIVLILLISGCSSNNDGKRTEYATTTPLVSEVSLHSYKIKRVEIDPSLVRLCGVGTSFDKKTNYDTGYTLFFISYSHDYKIEKMDTQECNTYTQRMLDSFLPKIKDLEEKEIDDTAVVEHIRYLSYYRDTLNFLKIKNELKGKVNFD